MTTPEKSVVKELPVAESLKAIARASPLNAMLVFIPVSWALNWALPAENSNKDTLVFVFSFLAIIPLAKLLGYATEELAQHVGSTLAGLLNATLGNAVELIVAIIALAKCQLRIVQSSLVGSILSNLLLVLGMCFFAGGLKYSEQGFGASATQLNSSLLTISVIAVLLPAAFHFTAQLDPNTETRDILAVSRGTSLILLVIYIGYLLFQLWSHAKLFEDDYSDVQKSVEYDHTIKKRQKASEQQLAERAKRPFIPNGSLTDEPIRMDSIGNSTSRANTNSSAVARMITARADQGEHPTTMPKDGANPSHYPMDAEAAEKDVHEEATINRVVTVALLVVVTVLVGVTAEWLVDSIDGLTDKGVISKEFVGIILLPIVGNAAEHVTAVTVSVKDKLNLSLSVAAGSSLQIALFVIPVIVILGWIMGKPMTLLFDPYESIVLFFSVLVVNYVVQDGKSNWLEGFLLMLLYVILALTFWFYPGVDPITC
ncbi:calcium/proton exchanger [Macrolepiota fuliginosa MF-IS2]|uniref:Calcium/proton exchanger n=1 Tax=Macrolepiota fuliginosa MF-IS2 TaxID=1400762 RepID=A0A9P5XJH8_9AGAR|nr:calcium/proton exchanger [Macrolepiota fuliginosa MF-IS2]